MTDAEIICTWMSDGKQYGYPWWTPNWHLPMRPRKLTLDALHEVEERLSRDQWWSYELELSRIARHHGSTVLGFVHAKAEQKITALAAVLRAGTGVPVEGEKP